MIHLVWQTWLYPLIPKRVSNVIILFQHFLSFGPVLFNETKSVENNAGRTIHYTCKVNLSLSFNPHRSSRNRSWPSSKKVASTIRPLSRCTASRILTVKKFDHRRQTELNAFKTLSRPNIEWSRKQRDSRRFYSNNFFIQRLVSTTLAWKLVRLLYGPAFFYRPCNHMTIVYAWVV